MLSVIVPIYNEERTLREVIERLFAAPCPIKREWIFVDDHSTDRSLSILESIIHEHADLSKMQLIAQSKNLGKGAAIRAGIKKATGQWILIQDADFEYDPNDIPALLAPLLSHQADVVYGSRFKKTSHQVHRTYHYFINYFLTVLSNLFSGIYLSDMETCYKIFRSDILKSMKLKSERFGIEIELTAYIAKMRFRIFEIPISYYPRTRLQGKKINWTDGIAALFHLVRFNFFVSKNDAFTKPMDDVVHQHLATQKRSQDVSQTGPTL